MIRHGRTRRRRWLAVLAAALVAGTAAAQSGETPSGGTPPPGGRPGGGADVDAALAFLAKQQSRDGSFGRANQLALTGMAGLAFLAAGSTPKRGPHAERIAKACEFILACQADGRAFTHPSSGYSAIHNHGYALLLLTQCLGEAGTLDKRLRPAIGAAVQASANSQEKNGGFTYFLYGKQPPEHRDMWSWDEASTTISQIQALRGAREAGFAVASRVLDRAGKYLARSQHKETGGFPYSIGGGVPRISVEEGSNKPTFAVTAATAAVLQALGTYEGDALDRAIAYMETFEPGRRDDQSFFFYGHYYGAQVMHRRGGPKSKAWLTTLATVLAERQRRDGSWRDEHDTLEERDSCVLSTAWAVQVLLLERGVLPLHEK